METWDALTARRNVREFEDRAIPEDQLDRILEAARRSPSSRNGQPWDFVVVTDREQLERLSKVWQFGAHVAKSAATVALVLPTGLEGHERETALFDLGGAGMAMMLTAADLGVGSGHSAVSDQDLAREVLALPADREAVLLIDMGYPAERPLKPLKRINRCPFEDVIHKGGW
jgi:nitroreductase